MAINFDDKVLDFADDDYQFEQWKKSDDYHHFDNEQIALPTPKYSYSQVTNAIAKAFESLQVTSEEVGKDVYEKLFTQHFLENLD